MGLHTTNEIESDGFGAYWAKSARQIPDKGDLSAYWRGISSEGDFLSTTPSYIAIRDPMLRLCHRSVNIPYLFAQYLRRFSSGRKYETMISRGHFICYELADTSDWVAPGLERQPDAAAGAPKVVEGALDVDKGAQAVLASCAGTSATTCSCTSCVARTSKVTTKSQPKSTGKFTQAEETVFEAGDLKCHRILEKTRNNPEGDRYPFNLSKPLPLIKSRNSQIVLVDYFFNNDLAYLQGENTGRTYTTSLTKIKAAKYDLKGIKDMVPNLWSPIKVAYEKHALLEHESDTKVFTMTMEILPEPTSNKLCGSPWESSQGYLDIGKLNTN
ncbi:hypothetical protein Tco_0943994 [Tanacetum coccineum]